MSAALSSLPTPGAGPATAKSELRKRLKQALKAADPQALAQQSAAICEHVLQLPQVQQAAVAVAFMPCEWLREVDASPVMDAMLQRGTALFLPTVKDKASNMAMLRVASLEGLRQVPPFNIVEPTELDEQGNQRQDLVASGTVPDVILLPGLGFDRSGGRLGRGGGYYDKFLGDVARLAEEHGRSRALLVALAFREQMIETVPMDAHDCRYDVLVTADGVQEA